VLTALTVAACFGGFVPGCGTRPGAPAPSAATTPGRVAASISPYKNTRPGVAYVGDAACVGCHAEIGRTYAEHPMGRSMSGAAGVMPEAAGTVFEVDGLVYSIERHDGRVFHRETRRVGAGGAAVVEAEVRFVIGSGTRGYSFLVDKGDGLYQSPIAWYAQGRRWDLAPDYGRQNLHFDRRITTGCLFCHANRFDAAPGKSPVFHGLAIGCERCHGPGELHARAAQAAPAGGKGAGKDLTIVNPADLEPPALREAVCQQCHYQGTERLNRPGRTPFEYRPGLPFDEYVAVLTSRADPAERDRAVGHVEEMRQSRCFVESGGKLGCISCHDPHRLPGAAERVAYYRDRCLACHNDRGCNLPRADRLARAPGDDCTSCHMPHYPSGNIAHTSQTNHTIPRNPGPARGPL
jgi:hypothetical protein